MEPALLQPEPGLDMTGLREFALAKIGSRLAVEPDLVAAFWNQIGAPMKVGRPDVTVVYCSVQWSGQSYQLLEFVGGETLEELVRRSDPVSCEREIPLFCSILDAFESAAKQAPMISEPKMELVDFGVGRANATVESAFHGTVLAGPGGVWEEQIFGEVDRRQIRALLEELCARLPGAAPTPGAHGPAKLRQCTVASLGARVLSAEPAPIAAAQSGKRLLVRTVASPYTIAVATAMLILLTLFGVGGFLARRTIPTNVGKLNLPPFSPAVETPIQIAQEPQPDPPPAIAVRPSSKRRAAKEPVASIVLARGARPIRQTSLQYPAEARKQHITGLVEMQVTIAEDGSVHSPRVLSGDPLLRAGLAEEISKWVYQPLRVNGKPVPMTTELAILFKLNP